MCKKSANDAFSAVVSRLEDAQSILVVTHGRPDGDGLGTMVALACAARAAGKSAQMLVPDEPPPRYEFLFEEDRCAPAEQFCELADGSDLIVIVDTSAFAQLDGLEEVLRPRRGKIVVIDHHATADDVGGLCWQDATAAASGVMVDELLEALRWPVAPRAAEALLTAITTDTGWLQFANTDSRCLRAVARLVDAGVRPDVLYRKIYQNDRPERLALIRRLLASLELHCDGQLAAMTLREADFQATGARSDETENLVNEPLRLSRVENAMLLVENSDCIRVSLRSRDKVDVAAVAREIGGGGHRRAAGARVQADIDELRGRLIAACAERLCAESR